MKRLFWIFLFLVVAVDVAGWAVLYPLLGRDLLDGTTWVGAAAVISTFALNLWLHFRQGVAVTKSNSFRWMLAGLPWGWRVAVALLLLLQLAALPLALGAEDRLGPWQVFDVGTEPIYVLQPLVVAGVIWIYAALVVRAAQRELRAVAPRGDYAE